MLDERYRGFLNTSTSSTTPTLEIELRDCGNDPEAELTVERRSGQWHIERGDFHATWDPTRRCGRVRQMQSPYALDSALRIVHSLLLSEEGGFLAHAASAIRNGKAYFFAGCSGAGKTTLSRLAPPDVTLLTDEISYIRRDGASYRAFGTPFAGELARPGENTSAPLAAWFLLVQGNDNRLEPFASEAEAARLLLRNILFFAREAEITSRVFDAACEFVARVPGYRMIFRREAAAWELVP
jgi:hypothetical protein